MHSFTGDFYIEEELRNDLDLREPVINLIVNFNELGQGGDLKYRQGCKFNLFASGAVAAIVTPQTACNL